MKFENPVLIYRMADYLGATLQVSKTGDISGKMIKDVVLEKDLILSISATLKGYILGTGGVAMVKGVLCGNLAMIALVSLVPDKAFLWLYDNSKMIGLDRFSPQELLIDTALAKYNQKAAKFSLKPGGAWEPAQFRV